MIDGILDETVFAVCEGGQLTYAETGTSMIAKLTSLTPTILTAALPVIFVVAGTINIIGRGAVKTDFARWGFPDGFNIVYGGLELVGAALLLAPSTRFWGLALLGMIMTGAMPLKFHAETAASTL